MKKMLMVMLAILVCAGLFAGGGQQSAASGNSGLTTIKVWGHNKPYHFTGASFTLQDWYDGSIPSRLWDKFHEEVTKMGIKLDMTLIMSDQMATAFQTLVASGQINDYDWVSPIAYTDLKQRANLVNQGLLMPLDTLIDQYSAGTAKEYYNNHPAGKLMKQVNTMADGHMYWIAHTNAFYYGDPSNMAGEPTAGGIRVDWLRKLNLPMPTTLDELFNTLKAFQDQDANKNGMKDEIAMYDIANSPFLGAFSQFFGIGGGNLTYLYDGKFLSPWYHPRAKDYVAYMQRLYKANLLKLSVEGNEQAANRVAFFGQFLQDTYYDQQAVVPAGEPNAYTASVIFQAYPDTPYIIGESPGVNQNYESGMFSIPAKSKNGATTIKLIDYFHSMEYMYLGEYGIEGYTYQIRPDGTWERFQVNDNNVGVDMYMTAMAEALPFACYQAPFPRMRKGDKHDILQSLIDAGRARGYPEGFQLKVDRLVDFYEGKKWAVYCDENRALGISAFPTAAEVDRAAAITPDLRTYSAELMTDLIMGEKSLNDWNTYMAELKRLGLDELLANYQARADRMK